jgi:hypothetical protein
MIKLSTHPSYKTTQQSFCEPCFQYNWNALFAAGVNVANNYGVGSRENKSARSCDSYPCGQAPLCWVNGCSSTRSVPVSYLAPPSGPPYSHNIIQTYTIYSPCVSAGEARVCDGTHSEIPSNSIDPALLKGDERKRTPTSNGEQRKRKTHKANLIKQIVFQKLKSWHDFWPGGM